MHRSDKRERRQDGKMVTRGSGEREETRGREEERRGEERRQDGDERERRMLYH